VNKKEVTMLCSFSTLDKTNLEAIQALEKDLGQKLLSFSCHDIAPAVIDDEALSKIGELEKKLGVVLVAVQ
jgi:catabolite regulation protein CreA